MRGGSRPAIQLVVVSLNGKINNNTTTNDAGVAAAAADSAAAVVVADVDDAEMQISSTSSL